MALSEELQGRFSDVIERANPLLLWRTLSEHFDNHPGVNAVFLKRDMLNRRLQSNEPLNKYFDDMDHFKQQLRRANQQLPDNEAVSVLLFNTIGVYPAVVNEHEVRLARGEDITWEQAIERLRLAEHARQEADNQQGRGGRVAQRDVAFVGNHGSSQGHGGRRRSSSSARNNQRRRSSSHSPRRSNKRHRSNSTVRSSDSLAKRKAKTMCNACGEVGHWRGDPECRQQGNDLGNSDRQRPANMVNVVIVKNNKSAPEKKGVLAVRDSMDVQRASADMVEWILDSGAAGSVTGDLTLFTELREDATSELLFGNGGTATTAVGTVLMNVLNEHVGKEEERLLDDVSYSKSTPFNLISQTYMQFACGFKLRLSEDQRTMWLAQDSLKLRFDYDRGVNRMWAPRLAKPVLTVQPKDVEDPMVLLHNRLSHVGMDTIKSMAGQKYNFGIQMQQPSFAAYECVPCLEAKTKRMSYSRGPQRCISPLGKLCVDLCSVGVDTGTKANQFLLVVDEATRYKWGYLIANKDQAAALIETLVKRLAVKFPKRNVSMLFSDGGGEFVNNQLQQFCDGQGIEARSTNAYSPQENSIVERANQTVIRQVQSLLIATQLPLSLWGEAFDHTIYTMNVTPTQALKGKRTPYEAMHGRRPDLSELHTWGCLVHAHIPDDSPQRKEKLSARTQLCLLLSYSKQTKGYKLLNLRTGSVLTCRGGNMKAHEQYTVDSAYVEKLLLNTYDYGDHTLPEHIPIVPIRTTMQTYLDLPSDVAAQHAAQLAKLVIVDEPSVPVGAPVSSKAAEVEPAAPVSNQVQTSREQDSAVEPAAPVGARKRKVKSKRGGRKRTRASDDDVNWEPTTQSVPSHAATSDPERPKRQRQQSVRLRDYVVTCVVTLNVEDDSQREHGTWDLVPRTETKGKRVISCRWVFALKRDAAGHIKLFKARLVIRGFLQRMGIDYTETYAPVVRFETIRCAILYALQRGWDVMQFDVKTAFLYGDLEEEVYMEQSPGFGEDSPHFICRLRKSLYGLKQSLRVWNKTLHKFLVKIGLERLDSDNGLYVRKVRDQVTLLLTVYVDDLLVMGPSDVCAEVSQQLAAEYELTALGPMKYLLGVEILIDRQRRHAIFCQRQYTREVLKRFHMEGCNGVATPEALRAEVSKPSKCDSSPPYRELVGALQYLVSASRPDIAHAVRHLSKYLSNYDHTHYAMAKRVLRHLASTRDYGLVMEYTAATEVQLVCYADADYANDPDDRKSVSGFVTFVSGNVVSYGSRKQEINAQSTTEAEYMAMNEGTRDLLWLTGLCEELNWVFARPEIRGDNKSCLYLNAKPGKHSKTKHIQNKFHLVRHLVEDEQLRTRHVGTKDMIADIMTKPLPREQFERCRDGMKVLRIDRVDVQLRWTDFRVIVFKLRFNMIKWESSLKDLDDLDKVCENIPLLGFNSGSYDMNLIKDELFSALAHCNGCVGICSPGRPKKGAPNGPKLAVSAIKSANGYMCLTAGGFKVLDITRYMSAGTSLHQYLEAYAGKCSCPNEIECTSQMGKGFFPYEYLTSYDMLDEPGLPPRSAFDSKLRSTKLTDKEWKRVQWVWGHYEMKTLRELLVWYNDLDVIPFMKAIKEQMKFFNGFGLDMFHDGVSLPGLAEKIMYQTCYEDENYIQPREIKPPEPFEFGKKRLESYRQQDKEANRKFTLTMDHLNELLAKQSYVCWLCYEPLTKKTASADRINNFKGHINGNIIITCKSCNCARKDIPIHVFKQRKLLQHNANRLIYSIDEEQKEIYDLMKRNITGGPSIIFNRFAKAGFTVIRGGKKKCMKIIGYDANALYLWCLMNDMPCGRPVTIPLYDELIDDILADKQFGFMSATLKHQST
ncbi:putative Polyprotein [Phytophthora palmivora]|uniref:Polyprotein n=1 Tax=Phytophthora palmivora TaxID=4796 RepID=A0A2P4X8U0_9STRA|nr:putative Polyprotein [Phytophthora palmivora]